jgi:beta-N-acetylhexosaminidase
MDGSGEQQPPPARAAARLLILGFHGTRVGRELARAIDAGVAAFVLYDRRNIRGGRQIRRLAAEIRCRCAQAGSGPPLLAVDHEGGVNSQLRSAGTVFPGGLALAAGGGPRAAGLAAAAAAREIRAAGLNLNLAPVLDLYDPRNPGIGVRSFRADPAAVARFGRAVLRAHRRAGVLAAAKHFPGNSATATDPHRGLAAVRRSGAALRRLDLAPYRALFRDGLPAVLTSHLRYPPLDGVRPATLSRRILTGLLRRRMGFRGAVVTDDLEMDAIERRWGIEGAAEAAVRAGADLVMVCHTPEKQRRVLARLAELVERDPSFARRAAESAARIARLARAAGRLRPGPAGVLRSAAHRRLADRLARDGIVVVRNRDGLLPLRLPAGARIGVVDPLHTMYGWNQRVRLGAAFRRRRPGVRDALFDPRAPDASRRAALALARESDVVVCGTYDARFSPPQRDLVRALVRLGKPLVVVATRDPRDVREWPAVRTAMATLGFYDVSLRAAADVALGLAPAHGRLPVAS